LPEGWAGKCWAAHQLSQEARGRIFIFADADTRMAPQAVASAVAAIEGGDEFLSFWPRQEMGTWGEILVVSLLPVMMLWLRPHWLERFWKLPGLGVANGQFIAVTRSAYATLGGHDAVRDTLVEDMALARLARRKGICSVNYDATELIHCRMYDSFSSVWDGFTKNMRAAFGGHLWAFALLGLVTLLFLLGPYLPWPWLTGASRENHRMLCGGLVACITLVRAALCVQFRTPLWAALLHPLSVTLMFFISINSWRKLSSCGVAWKGRIYRR
jgi:chlorobactene glucosyltransferase